ncbi:MAG: hypothetical protein AAFY45_27100 [Bacteroidota bacterium]
MPRYLQALFTSQRIYTSPLAPELLQKELKQVFQAFESHADLSIKDEHRPFDASFEKGLWKLSPRDIEKGEERFLIRGKVESHQEEGSQFVFEAKASKRQKWSLFKDSLYGLFLTTFTALMEVMQDMPLALILVSIPIMLIFVGVYLRKSQQKILNYRWEQLDKNLGELAQAV